ncbi:MAG TPA: carboxypeptidase-like regulatory domain-containing protein, partial [Pirellulaceae bacterium]
TYQNVGDTDALPPLISVLGSDPLSLDPQVAPHDNELRFLAISEEGPAGVLSPGQSVSVPFYFFGNNLSIEALSMSPVESATMDWDELRAEIRPAAPSVGWDAVFDTQLVSAGPTVGDYIRLLANAATQFQTRTGMITNDPDALHGFLLGEGFAERDAVIRGRIFLDEANRPAGGVSVTAVNRVTGDAYGTKSTADGLVRIGEVPAGTYDLLFDDVVPPIGLSPIVVPVAGLPVEQSWIVGRGGGIRGRVGVPAGVAFLDPNSNVQIVVNASDEVGNQFTAAVDADGVYEFKGLVPGLYDLTVSTSTSLPGGANHVLVQEGTTTGLIDLFSAPGGSASGTVRDADTGLPVPHVAVSIVGNALNPRSTVTNMNGQYVLHGVTPGLATLAVTSSGLFSEPLSGVNIQESQITSGVELLVDFNLLANIDGHITFGGNALAGATIELIQGGQVVQSTVSNAVGEYLLRDVLPGDYALRADEFQASPTTIAISLSENQDLIANFALTDGSRIHGVVTHRGGGTTNVAPAIRLAVLKPNGDLVPVLSDDAGAFALTHLEVGSYALMLADGSHRQSFEITDNQQELDMSFELQTGLILGRLWRHDGTTPAEDVVVGLVRDDQLVGTTSTLSNGRFAFPYLDPGTYDLVFDDENAFHRTVADVAVVANTFTDVGDLITPTASLNLTLTDSMGTALDADGLIFLTSLDNLFQPSAVLRHTAPGVQSFSGLAPGRYLVQAGLAYFTYIQTEIDILAGSNTLNLPLEQGAIVEGTVTKAVAQPVAGLSVFAYQASNPRIRWEATTDSQGGYKLGLPAGSYTIVISDLRSVDALVHLGHATIPNVT